MSKPRPRPRPRIAKRSATEADPAASNDTTAASGSSVLLGPNTRAKNSTLLDEDDLFLRNRGRTKQDWRQLQQLARTSVSPGKADDDSECEDLAEYSPKHQKKRQNKQNDIPRWQAVGVADILSSDNDDDLQIIESNLSDEREKKSPRKRRRERSRSRSITPPPALPAHQLANARNLVRQALAVAPRAPSPTYLADESTDTIVLDPELAVIAEAVKKEAQLTQNETEQTGGPEVVTIKVRWRPHPFNVSAGNQVWIFKMKRYDTLRDLFEELADLAAVLVDQLVVSYDNKRVYSSGTPHSLRIWAEGELEACDKHTDEYIRTNRHRWSASPSRQDNDKSTRSLSPASPSDSAPEAESTGGEKLKLVFRSMATKDKSIPLTVRSTTTCGAIVKAFLRAAGLPDVYSNASSSGRGKKRVPYPQLMIDGDKMASEAVIGDAGLDDGDLVEVVGLSEA
ncbi:hypothetical protein F5I97DRAFT_1883914 [Phlebopus sp. FC_14]|nr:hypothetical protein F5I97DRAFT_1883914 [Phlebopus sp. FC_14]